MSNEIELGLATIDDIKDELLRRVRKDSSREFVFVYIEEDEDGDESHHIISNFPSDLLMEAGVALHVFAEQMMEAD